MDSISQYIKIEEDVLYLKGVESTLENKNRQFVISLLNGTDFSVEKIANLASVSIEFVEKMKKENK